MAQSDTSRKGFMTTKQHSEFLSPDAAPQAINEY